MNISVFGLGYVGTVSAACLAQEGHVVTGVDINPKKTEMIASGNSPIVEPGLAELIDEVVKTGNLQVTLDSQEAIHNSVASLICVGTPSNDNGSLKVDHVLTVCREIGSALATSDDYHVVIVRSTVLPGTVEGELVPLLEKASGKRAGVDFGVCMNPEFLREGSAIDDYINPSLVVIGEYDQRSGYVVQELYRTVTAPIVRTTIQTAEMVKYVSNAYHALKVSFANEIGNLSKAHGIDGQEVMEIFALDQQLNISAAYLKPGFAFGGSCLPKDLRALVYRAKEMDIESPLLGSILPSNHRQVEWAIKLVERTGSKRIGVLGLSFKPDTDDLRESPAITLVETLLGRGFRVRIFDEKLKLSQLVGANKTFLEKELPHIASLMCNSIDDILSESEVLVITNGSRISRSSPMVIVSLPPML